MTNQEAFNIAYLGLKSQGFKKSECVINRVAHCAYNSNVGHCAVGWLIKDVELDEEANYFSIGKLSKHFEVVNEILDGVDLGLISQLQNAHDQSTDAIDMRDRLHCVAGAHSIIVPKNESDD